MYALNIFCSLSHLYHQYPFIVSVRCVIWSNSSGDTITSTRKPFVIREDEMTAYERRTGFHGFGEYLESLGEIHIVRPDKCRA